MAGITDYLASKVKSLTPDKWDGFVRWLDNRFRVLEEKADITDRVADSLLARGLQVIEDGIGPTIIAAEQAAANVKAMANLGMIFTSPSTTTVLVGMGTKTFTIPANRKDQFSPAAIMMAYAGDDYANAITGFAAAYDRTTGVLTLDVIEVKGSGIFSAWTLTPVATTADLEALRDQVQADRLQAGLNAGAAVNAKNDAQSIATDFRAKYLGTRATDPTTDGNGNPVSIGALYTNAGSGKLRYYGLSGWQDTTAGSNIVRYTFVTDDRGTAPYPLPEAPASKDNCFVIVGNAPLKGSAFNVDGTNFSFVTNPGVGVTVEVKIIAQLAIGIPSDETVDAAKIKATAASAIRTKLGLNELFAARPTGPTEPVTLKSPAGFSAEDGSALISLTPEEVRVFAQVMKGGYSGRDYLINGNFRRWLRGTSQTTSGYGSHDRWMNSYRSSTMDCARGSFTPGQAEVPGFPRFYVRTAWIPGPVAGDSFAVKSQIIHDVTKLAGKLLTITFWARASYQRPVPIEIKQYMGGNGATPGEIVSTLAATPIIGTAWQRFSYAFTAPSLTGRVLGPNDDSHTEILFWLDGGTTYASRHGNMARMPQGWIEHGMISIVDGDATNEVLPVAWYDPDIEDKRMDRYCQSVTVNIRGYLPANDWALVAPLQWPAMRRSPDIIDLGTGALYNAKAFNFYNVVPYGARAEVTSNTQGDTYVIDKRYILFAE